MRAQPHDFPCDFGFARIRHAQRHAAGVVKGLLLILVPDGKPLVGRHHVIDGNHGRLGFTAREDPIGAVECMFNVAHGNDTATHIKHLGKADVFHGKSLELARFVTPCIQIPASSPIHQTQRADLASRLGVPSTREIGNAKPAALRESRSHNAEKRRIDIGNRRHDHLDALKELLGLNEFAGKHRQEPRAKRLHLRGKHGLRIILDSAEKLNDS